MKVGILTCHAAYNYGSVLQAYALQEAVRSLGYDCELIDYRPFWFDFYHVFFWENPFGRGARGFCKILAKNIYRLACLPVRVKRKRKFEAFFKKYYHMSKWSGRDLSCLPSDYDVYVVGSDQVWNPVIFGDSLACYMGQFRRKASGRLIGYAISAGAGEKLLDYRWAHSMQSFDSLSVREESLQSLVKRLCGFDVPLVLDPTLLVGRDFWLAMSQELRERDYVLLYMVYPSHAAVRLARRRAKELSCRVRVISSGAGIMRCSRIRQDGPNDFVNLFRNAKSVVTTSFHGMVFSILFERQFYYVRSNPAGENRQQTLLSIIGLGDRIINGATPPDWGLIDYASVRERLKTFRTESRDFLESALCATGEKAR